MTMKPGDTFWIATKEFPRNGYIEFGKVIISPNDPSLAEQCLKDGWTITEAVVKVVREPNG